MGMGGYLQYSGETDTVMSSELEQFLSETLLLTTL